MKLAMIPVRLGLAVALMIRWARRDGGLSQKELGVRAGVSQQQIAKLENPDENPSVETLEKVARALGQEVNLVFSAPHHVSVPPRARGAPVRKRA
jgi:transcriptional regulator with XRE-family HTH domain